MTYIPFFQKRFEELKKHHKRKKPLICIDGPPGTGKNDAAQFLKEELEKYGIDIEILTASDFTRPIAKKMGYKDLDEFCEKRAKDIQLMEEVDIILDNMLLEHGIKNGGIIVARLSISVLGDEADARIFITADARKIAERIAKDKRREEHGKPMSEIIKRIKNRDKHDIKAYEHLYKIDYLKTETKKSIIIENNGTLNDLKSSMQSIAKDLIKN